MRWNTHLQGPVSISEKTSYRKISWSLEAARFVFRIVPSLWNLTDTSAALLPMCLSNFNAIRQFKVPISWLRDFTRSYDKTSFRILKRGPDHEMSLWYALYLMGELPLHHQIWEMPWSSISSPILGVGSFIVLYLGKCQTLAKWPLCSDSFEKEIGPCVIKPSSATIHRRFMQLCNDDKTLLWLYCSRLP